MNSEPHKRIYLDYNATAPCREEVVAEVMRVMEAGYGNPSSLHHEGQHARSLVEDARERIASSLGAQPLEIVFTSCGSEADTLAILGSVMTCDADSSNIVTSRIEHPAVLVSCLQAEARGMATIAYAGCDARGLVEAEQIAELFTPETALVSIMHANNEVGTVQPVRRIADLAHEKGIAVHTDAVQSLGRVPVNIDELGVDLLSVSGHKLGGPKGIGVLYIRTGTALRPLLVGGSQERERRAGTENVAGIVGLAKAVEMAVEAQPAESQRLAALKDLLWTELSGIEGISLNGMLAGSLPNTLNISFDNLGGEDLMQVLDLAGIAVSTGSACAVGASKASHVIAAMGDSAGSRCGPLRISMGYRTSESDVAACAREIGKAVIQLRESGCTCCCGGSSTS
jgi:cysteine desulfurase